MPHAALQPGAGPTIMRHDFRVHYPPIHMAPSIHLLHVGDQARTTAAHAAQLHEAAIHDTTRWDLNSDTVHHRQQAAKHREQAAHQAHSHEEKGQYLAMAAEHNWHIGHRTIQRHDHTEASRLNEEAGHAYSMAAHDEADPEKKAALAAEANKRYKYAAHGIGLVGDREIQNFNFHGAIKSYERAHAMHTLAGREGDARWYTGEIARLRKDHPEYASPPVAVVPPPPEPAPPPLPVAVVPAPPPPVPIAQPAETKPPWMSRLWPKGIFSASKPSPSPPPKNLGLPQYAYKPES